MKSDQWGAYEPNKSYKISQTTILYYYLYRLLHYDHLGRDLGAAGAGRL